MKLPAILRMQGVSRVFAMGERPLTALQDIHLTIHAGTMVALVGPSGSGKSTLLNLLGCLDQPSGGSYRVWGREARRLDSDALASLRRKHFGFIFQRYQLLPGLTAAENVEGPAVYARTSPQQRRQRALGLLARLGLAERAGHLPHELSGGQQQRVSVARALMNGGQVILADEPTGALDEASGRQLMHLLQALHAQGHTIVMATHDAQLAACAERIIEIRDGRIVADRANPQRANTPADLPADLPRELQAGRPSRRRASPSRLLGEAFKMATAALLRHRLRTGLTLLGIVVGIASLVSVIAIGEGGQRRIRETLGSLTAHTVEIYRGSGWGDPRAQGIHTLVPDDLQALQEQPYIASVTPMTRQAMTARHEAQDAQATVNGVGPAFFKTRGMAIAEGRAFSADELAQQAQVVVIDQATRARLYPEGGAILGSTLIVGKLPLLVIGVTSARSQDFYLDRGLNLLVPYTTAGSKLFGRLDFDSISVHVGEAYPSGLAEKNIQAVVLRMHGEADFFTNNMDALARAYASTTRSVSTMLSVIAAISLVVGGIGVMNIMLVSVTERTREIGIRMAVGARQSDILRQFLIEAVVVCLIGAVMGLALALGLGLAFSFFVQEWSMVFTPAALVSALLSSTLTGVGFGYLPARKASRLNPVDALVRD